MVLDFFDLGKVKDQYLQNNFPPGFSEEESWRAMGVDDPSTREGLLKAVPQNENQAKLLMMMLFKHRYQNHGRNIASVMGKVADYLDSGQDASASTLVSIASAIKLGRLEFDDIGNPTMQVTLSPQVVDYLVSMFPESVVNMSFELGDFSLTYSLYDKKLKHPEMARQGPSKITVGETTTYRDYQGNTITKEEYDALVQRSNETEVVLLDPTERRVNFLDGYASDKTYQNLRKLTQVARNHPEKMFIAAGGNPTYLQGLRTPDIREARLKLEEQGLWPDNLVIVGFTSNPGVGGQSEVRASYGADIYVSSEDLDNLGFQGASSYATPVVTEITRQLIAQGSNTHKQIKEELMQLTQVAESWEGSERVEYRLLDLDKAKDSLANSRQSKQ